MRSPLGDHLTCLRVFEQFEEACNQTNGGGGGSSGGSSSGGNKMKMTIVEWCEKHFLRYRALRNAKNIRDQVFTDPSILPRLPIHLCYTSTLLFTDPSIPSPPLRYTSTLVH